MPEVIPPDISGTAFVVNYSRARLPEISHDPYAYLWVTPEAIALWDELARQVYPNDDLNLSLRNRFYLDLMERYRKENPGAAIIVLASGFTNYPFLLSGEGPVLEIDLPHILHYKRQQLSQWIQQQKVPDRQVIYEPADLNSKADRERVKNSIRKIIGNHPSLITLEGLTYYLNKNTLDDLFTIFREVQSPGSLVAMDYWKPETLQYPVMVRLKDFLDRKFGYTGQQWFLFDESFIRSLPGFQVISSTDITSLELSCSTTRLFQGKDNKIPVYFSVLIRKEA